MFTYPTTIRLHQTDAAGLLFFANHFKIVHDAYETFLESKGTNISEVICHKDYFIPIVHAEADYKKPLTLGDHIVVQIVLEKTGTTSFVLSYTILDDQEDVAGTAKTVHVATDRQTQEKTSLPQEIRELIQEI